MLSVIHTMVIWIHTSIHITRITYLGAKMSAQNVACPKVMYILREWKNMEKCYRMISKQTGHLTFLLIVGGS